MVDEKTSDGTSIKEYRFYGTDRDSHAELDRLFTTKPDTSFRAYFDDKLILEYIIDDCSGTPLTD